MKQIIGFATQFYTLWNYEKQPKYTTDAYGNHHCSGIDHKYYYIRNISIDLDKVKLLFPNVPIDDELRGKTSNWERNEKLDLPENYFWAGKYAGKLVDDIMESDFQYCLLSSQNYSGATSRYIQNHPKYIAHFEAIEKAKQDEINSKNLLKVGDVVELEFTRNGYNLDDCTNIGWTTANLGDVEINIKCYCKAIYGMYPYLMPIINGKAQRTKGKKLTVTVTEVVETYLQLGTVKQIIKIK